jgi:hypothetical protein
MSTMAIDVWTYRETTLGADLNKANIVGYSVEALDGSIGKVDEATFDAGSAFIVVDTGPWIFGKKVMLPAGVIKSADHDDETIFVDRTKDEIKNAPEFDDSLAQDDDYRGRLGTYYGAGAGDRDLN